MSRPITDGISPFRRRVEQTFVFLAFIVLPAVVYWYISFLETVTQAEHEKELLRQRLLSQAQELPEQMTHERIINAFLRRALHRLGRSGLTELQETIERYEREYPGVFQWAFWDRTGKLVSGELPQALPGERVWQTIADQILYKLKNPKVPIDDLPNSISVSAMAQRALGPANSMRRLLDGRAKLLPASYAGAEGAVLWEIASQTYNQKTCELLSFEAMGLVFAKSDALPEEFGLPEVVHFSDPDVTSRKYPLVAFSVSEPQKLWIDKRLQRFPALGSEVRRRFLEDPTEEIEVNGWLGVNVSFQRQAWPYRCLVMGDLGEIQKQMERRRLQAIRISLAWVFLGVVILLGPWRGNPMFNSLKIRLAGAFLLAMVLPILGLGWTGKSYLESEKVRLLRAVKDRCRERVRQIELRYQAFQLRQEVVWQDRMVELVSRNENRLEMIEAGLASMVAQGLFTNYYITDPDGRAVLMNYEVRDDADRRALQGINLMLKMIMAGRQAKVSEQQSKSPGGSDLLREEVRENIVRTLGEKADPQKFLRAGRLYPTNLGNLSGFSMSLFFEYEGKTRLIWIWATVGCIERAFAMDEVRRWRVESGATHNLPYRLVFIRPGEYAMHDVPATVSESGQIGAFIAQKRQIKSAQEESAVWDGVEQYVYITPVTFISSFLLATWEDLGHVNETLARGYARLYGSMGLMAFLAIVFGIVLSGGMIRPIEHLDQAFGEVRDGNLAVLLPDMGRDEIGRLGATFNTMVGQLRERERMRAYVSDRVLEKVRDEHAESGKSAQVRPAAILFSDIRGFTTLSEKYPPVQIFEMLNGFLGGVEGIIRAHQGDVDKFIGDAVMAVFLGEAKDIARSAVKAALEMRLFLEHFNAERQKAGLFKIDIGIGINTGDVLWGDVGSTRRKDSTVIGDEVNLASRLESASKLGRHTRIVISESSSVLASDEVELEEMSVREVKGKEQSVRMFEVIGRKSRLST